MSRQNGSILRNGWTICASTAVAKSSPSTTRRPAINTGNRFGGDPAVGAWVTYGLGTLNDNLPGFVVLPRTSYPQGGASNWSNGYLPADHQGTPLRPEGSPILDLHAPAGMTRKDQRNNLDLLAKLNRKHFKARPDQGELDARMSSYELAYRMQMEVPGILDLKGETEKTKEAYGIGDSKTDSFGRKCLLARRLVEKGVRFVQAYAGNWDSHDYIERAHGSLIRSVDKPIAALLGDLKERGLLEDTLVVWCGEFGRTPDNGIRGGGASYGRDHNAKAMTMWFAGGGTKAGHTIGATDEIGAEAVECVHHIRDVHVYLAESSGTRRQQADLLPRRSAQATQPVRWRGNSGIDCLTFLFPGMDDIQGRMRLAVLSLKRVFRFY